jgi:erythromycin esterase-like protein
MRQISDSVSHANGKSLFNQTGEAGFLLTLRDDRRVANVLRDPRLERAIGVIYLSQTERHSHYFDARLSDQFDAVIHFNETQALEPLERYAQWESGEPPETFPTGV